MIVNPYLLGASSLVERTPLQLSFSPYLSTLLFDPQPIRAEVTDFVEMFSSTANIDVTGIKFGGVAGTASTAAGVLTVSGSTGTAVMEKASISSYSVPDVFVELDISQQGTSGTLDIVQVGIFLDGSNFVVASLDRAANIAWIQWTTASDNLRVDQISYTVPTGSIKLGFGMVMNRAAVYVDSGSGWAYVTGGDLTTATKSTPGSLSGWRAGFCLASTVATTWKFTRLRSGRFGSVGFRDPTIVTNKDGSIYVESGKAYLTASTNLVTGGGEVSRLTMHCLDLETMTIENCGVFYVIRSGQFSPDINLHVVDNGDGTQELFWATWGTGPFSGGKLEVVHSSYTGDFHLGGHALSTWTALTLPIPVGSRAGAYDPMVAWDGTKWVAAYAAVADTESFGSSFFPSMASSPNLSTWTAVGSDPTGGNTYEGPKLFKAKGSLWELAGGPQGIGTRARIYDASMAYLGDLSATFSGGDDTQPHPMVFNYGDYSWLITFDNTRTNSIAFSWGKYIVQRSARYV